MVEHADHHLADARRICWARLVGDHDRIAGQCRALAELAVRPDRPAEAASILLLELAVVLADHLGVEDQVIDRTGMAIRTGVTPQAAAAMVHELEGLRADWVGFVACWTPAAVAERWSGFATEATAMTTRLTHQVRRENELLYAEALRCGIIDRGQPILH